MHSDENTYNVLLQEWNTTQKRDTKRWRTRMDTLHSQWEAMQFRQLSTWQRQYDELLAAWKARQATDEH